MGLLLFLGEVLVGEKEIKSLVLSHLISSGSLTRDGLVFSEMNLAKKVRRLDLGYVCEGKMIAVEIKSEKDTLARLIGQVDEYCKYFDKVVVAVAPKFVKKVEELLVDKSVGVWEVSKDSLRVVRKGKIIKGACKGNYLDLMTRRELSILAKKVGVVPGELGIYDLKIAVRGGISRLSKSDIKSVLVDGLHRRFMMASERFMKKAFLEGRVSPSDVDLLSPYRVVV